MSISDFLFEGKSPTPVTLTGTQTTALPEWYTQYTTDMLGKAKAISNLPYAQYTGPRVAAFTPTEKTGFEATKTAAEAYQPFLGQAGAALTGASQTFPEAVNAYMNPYTQNVVNQIADQGVRQLTEKFLPAVGQEFIQAGQFGVGPGSTRMGEFGARALRDVQENVLAEQAKALQAGYGQAADIFQSDVARKAGLAGTAADIAGMAQKYGLTGAEAVGSVGAKERAMQQANLDLGYQDFLRQEAYPKEQIKFLSDVLGGVQLPKTEIRTEQKIPGQDDLTTGLSDAANTYKVLDEILKGSTGSNIGDLLKKYFGGNR